MSCSKCCGFKPFFGKVDYVIREYPPSGNFTSYNVPTIYIDSKGETGYLLISKKNGQSKWISFSLSASGIKKIITKCGDILPIDGAITISNGEGIILTCKNEDLKFSLDIPIKSNLGGTGFTTYNLGDILVGDKDGFLQKLSAGKIGQVLGIKEDGTIGYITSSATAPIQQFTISPCGKLIPNDEGLIGIELSENFTCELNEEKNIAKVDVKIPASEAITKIITPCGTIAPVNNTVKLTIGEGLDTTCKADELITTLKVPVPSNLGGTGIKQYNKGDVLIGKENGTLEKLPKGQVGQALGIDANGNLTYIDVSGGGGTKKIVAATARFPVTTITWGQNNWYPLGSQGNVGYIKIRDQDGDNFQANNLQVGDGTIGNYVIFTVPYPGLWAVSYQATYEVNNLDRETIIQHSVAWGKSYEKAFRLREFDSFSNGKRKSVVGTKILPFEKGDIVFIEVYIGRDPSDPNLQVTMRSYWNPPSFDSYIGFGLIEEGNVTIPTMEGLLWT